MMSYKYGNTESKMREFKTFKDYLEYRQNRSIANKTERLFETQNELGLTDGIIYQNNYYYYGKEYYLGPQYIRFDEYRQEVPFGIYTLVGIDDDGLNNDVKNMLVLEDKKHKKYKVRNGSVLIKKADFMAEQKANGFPIPGEILYDWPDVFRHPDTNPMLDETRQPQDESVFNGLRTKEWLIVIVSGLILILTKNFFLFLLVALGSIFVLALIETPEAIRTKKKKEDVLKRWNAVREADIEDDKKRFGLRNIKYSTDENGNSIPLSQIKTSIDMKKPVMEYSETKLDDNDGTEADIEGDETKSDTEKKKSKSTLRLCFDVAFPFILFAAFCKFTFSWETGSDALRDIVMIGVPYWIVFGFWELFVYLDCKKELD